MKLYENSVKNPVGTSLIFIGIVLIGLMFYRQLPVDLLPDIEVNMASVMTSYPGAGAEDVETNVTRPLEDVLNSTENIKEIKFEREDGKGYTDHFTRLEQVSQRLSDTEDIINITLA